MYVPHFRFTSQQQAVTVPGTQVDLLHLLLLLLTPRTTTVLTSAGTSWLYDNTDLSPPPPPVPPPPPCDNATRVGAYRECSWTVMIGARDSSHSWTPIEKVVKADHDDCFRIEGCGVWGAVGRMCMAGYKDKAQLLVTRNGTTVGEGHCCAPGVKDYV